MTPDLATAVRLIGESLKRSPLVVLVGAGASMDPPARLASWKGLVQRMADVWSHLNHDVAWISSSGNSTVLTWYLDPLTLLKLPHARVLFVVEEHTNRRVDPPFAAVPGMGTRCGHTFPAKGLGDHRQGTTIEVEVEHSTNDRRLVVMDLEPPTKLLTMRRGHHLARVAIGRVAGRKACEVTTLQPSHRLVSQVVQVEIGDEVLDGVGMVPSRFCI
jgi:hypothetical protein